MGVDKSRQEKHGERVKERQAKANPREGVKGRTQRQNIISPGKETAAVQYTAPGTVSTQTPEHGR